MSPTKQINTLVEDIHSLILSGVDSSGLSADEVTNICDSFGISMATFLKRRVEAFGAKREPYLRMSMLGKEDAQVWYELNGYEPEPLTADTLVKFLYGDVVEELVLALCELAGHKVERRQEEVELNGVLGHLDAIIDGELVDVKSASSYSFKKFEDGTLKDNDAFGYIYQMAGYSQALGMDKGYFLVLDKGLGYLTLMEANDLPDASERIDHIRSFVGGVEPPPSNCSIKTEKNGNKILSPPCSYCSFKKYCHPELRTFIYSTGPKFFTKVESEPRVGEVTVDDTVSD